MQIKSPRLFSFLFGLLLTGCHISSQESSHPIIASDWFNIGYQDAISGSFIQDNEALAEWDITEEIDRDIYIQGYLSGQYQLCQPAILNAWGEQGKSFPASCHDRKNVDILLRAWQQGYAVNTKI